LAPTWCNEGILWVKSTNEPVLMDRQRIASNIRECVKEFSYPHLSLGQHFSLVHNGMETLDT
jgi:hypothetical protein